MRGRRIVVRPRYPIHERRNRFEPFGHRKRMRGELISRLVQCDAIQPDDVVVVICELRMIAIVRPD